MNIIINNNKLDNYIDKFIKIEDNNITFLSSKEYTITVNNTNNITLNLELLDNVSISLFIISMNNDIKINYNHTLNKNSNLKIFKFYFNKNVSVQETINLNGEAAVFSSNFSSITKNNEDYHIIINHNNKNTNSYISNKCICCDNSNINFIIDSILDKGNTNCIMDQTTKILTLGDANAKIEPNMFINDESVEAKHGSSIGTFSYDDVFYLMSRGISENDAIDLLLKGFIFSNLELNLDTKAMIYECIKSIRR